MGFKHANSYTDQKKGTGVTGNITRRNDAIFLRNKYQTELNNAHAALVNMVHYAEEKMTSLKNAYNNSQRLKKDIEAKMDKRKSLYTKLESMLVLEKGHEKEMWFQTLNTRVEESKNKNISFYQRNRNTDVDSINVGGTSNYPDKYPDSKLQPKYSELITDIDKIESEVTSQQHHYNKSVSDYNYLLSLFTKDILKSNAKLEAYESILKEGSDKLNNCSYTNSIFYKMSSEQSKSEVMLDTLSHRSKQFKDTLDLISNEVSQYQGKKFVEMEY